MNRKLRTDRGREEAVARQRQLMERRERAKFRRRRPAVYEDVLGTAMRTR